MLFIIVLIKGESKHECISKRTLGSTERNFPYELLNGFNLHAAVKIEAQ